VKPGFGFEDLCSLEVPVIGVDAGSDSERCDCYAYHKGKNHNFQVGRTICGINRMAIEPSHHAIAVGKTYPHRFLKHPYCAGVDGCAARSDERQKIQLHHHCGVEKALVKRFPA
jgi:hypothetical protein